MGRKESGMTEHTHDRCGGCWRRALYIRSAEELPLCSCPGRRPQGERWRLEKGEQAKERLGGHPRHSSGTPCSHLPCPGLSPVARSPAGDPVRSPLRELTLGLAELVVVLQSVAGRAAAVAPALLLPAVVRAAAVVRRAVGEAHLWADTEDGATGARWL